MRRRVERITDQSLEETISAGIKAVFFRGFNKPFKWPENRGRRVKVVRTPYRVRIGRCLFLARPWIKGEELNLGDQVAAMARGWA